MVEKAKQASKAAGLKSMDKPADKPVSGNEEAIPSEAPDKKAEGDPSE